METCPQCHKPIKYPHARLVRDECGHKKCRICLMEEEDGCRICAAKKKIKEAKKRTNEKKISLLPGTTRKRRKKIILCQSENKQQLLHVRTKEKDDIKMLRQANDFREEVMPEKGKEDSEDTSQDNQANSEPDFHSPAFTVETEGNVKNEVNAGNDDDRQSVTDSEEETLEVKDERKRKPLQIASHITILPGNPTTYTCNICVKTFKRREHVRYHNFCDTGDKPFKCEFCNQGFITRSHYDCHILTHTGARPFVCETCNKGFRQKDKLTRHIRIHTGEKPYVCQTCGKSFSASHSLKGHYRTHTGEKPYLCTQCGRRFSEAMNLRKHLVVHTGEKNFTCEECGKRFGHKYSLNHHRRSHSRERPFWCLKCTRSFNSKKELKRHSIVHSDAHPFSCSICDLSFRRKDNLERHMKNTHPETRMNKYVQYNKDCQQQSQQQENTPNIESTGNSESPNSNSKSEKNQTIQQDSSQTIPQESSHINIDGQKKGNVKSQKTSCIKSISRAKDKEKVKPYVELVVPPSLLRKLPEPTEENITKNVPEKPKKFVNTIIDVNKMANSMNSVNVTNYREISDPIHNSNMTGLVPDQNFSITGTLNEVQNLSSKGTLNPVQNLSAIGNINRVENLSAIGSLTSVHDLSTSGTLNSIQNLNDPGTLNSVRDLSISSYNPTNVVSFKQMLDPVNSNSVFAGASLFQEIPDAIQQKSQAVPVINSPITPSYSFMNYEGNPRTSDTSNYSNIIYNEDTGINSLPLSYSVISYDRDLETTNVPTNYPIINYIPRPTYCKEKIIIEGTNCVPTITKASNVFPSSVSTSNVIQPTVTNMNTNKRFFSCKKTGKVLETDMEIPFTPTRTLQSDLHWRKRTIELSQQEQEMNDQIELDWKRY